MTTYLARLDGGAREVPVEVFEEAPGRYLVRLGGAVHHVDAFLHDPATLSLLVGTRSFSVTVDRRPTRLEVRVGSATVPLEIGDERRRRRK